MTGRDLFKKFNSLIKCRLTICPKKFANPQLYYMKKIIRTTTIPSSMRGLLTGQLKFMSEYYDVIAISSGGEHFDKLLEEQNIRGYVVPFTRKTFSILSDLKSFLMLIRIFKKEKPFIVHSHTSKDGLLCMLAAWLCGVPHRLYTIAGLADLSGIRGVMLNIAEWLTFKCSTKLYPISHNLMYIYIKKGMFNESKAKVILNGSSNGFEVDYFKRDKVKQNHVSTIKKEYQISDNDFVYCSIGRVVRDKGINELVKAFSQLQKEKSNTHLLILGNYEQSLDPILPATVEEINNNFYIHHVGYQADIRPFLLVSDVLVHASYREGFGNVIAQAGLMNLPCIVTNICGPNEIIKEGINGNIIPRKDTDALYYKMKFYYDNRDEVRRMGSNARELIVSRYKRADMWQAILEEYQSFEK